MLSVPGRGPEKADSAAARIREHFSGCIAQPAVHRLDMDTSGLMVFALTAEAHRNLSIQFRDNLVRKRYTAMLDGIPDERLGGSGRIELSFRLDPDHRPFQVYDPVNGKIGITDWKILEIRGGNTFIEYTPLTGRTHQLRLHSAHPVHFSDGVNTGGMGCPITGDRLYGSSSDSEHAGGARMMLHAAEISFSHPESGRIMRFRSEPDF